ncbi:wax ester/triacylglycerol synthase family O-acyltransferase [Nocardia panacis]|uniref:Diacylglycerol O-acyltransferase n=1 Tax=Nocardia panacis TaxID=2340916 RepID=A0A3A4KMX3_9NOCA|nr:wax ester/triacylglycerol synthase family O-acyltransferase [Nocardia panacis]RJO76908.1 wax ester/triacylglycerol synthase family O-acyltransferase [Nocardia panacis]
MEFVSPIDAVFLLAESREHPMHVGAVQLFEAPEDAGPDFARRTHETLLAQRAFDPTFRKRPAKLWGTPQLAWSAEEEVELEYHLRHSALPGPGRIDQLLELASGLHSTLLDRHRPLWEIHLIEGVGGRFAVYAKMHHALIDGVSAQRLLQRTLSADPTDTEIRVPWHLPRRLRTPHGRSGLARKVLSAARSAPTALGLARDVLLRQQLTLPFAAPRTMFNVPIGGARRCAVRSWPLERIRQVRKATGATVNDVVLTMAAGALRAYLLEHHALPDSSLIAMVPMSLREEDDNQDCGNKLAAILCDLGTDEPDPLTRLQTIRASMLRSKQVYATLSPRQSMALSALMLSPLALSLLPALLPLANPPFNIVISNVPGPREPRYWNGARLDASYPMSIPFDGQAVNITLTTTADNLDFGIVGCRRSVPGLPRLLDHLESALVELEAVG